MSGNSWVDIKLSVASQAKLTLMKAEQSTEFTGFHSTIEVGYHPDGRKYLDKQYGYKSGGITLTQADMLIALMQRFDEKAEELGVEVAKPFRFEVTPNSKPGFVTLHELTDYVGPNLKHLLASGDMDNDQTECLVKEAIKMHGLVFEAGWPISLDPPLPNFCLSNKGNLVYIDQMPPRQVLDDGRIFLDFPELYASSQSSVNGRVEGAEFIRDRYFTPKQAQVIGAQIMRDTFGKLHPSGVKDQIGKFLGERAYRYVDLSPEIEWSILDSPDPFNVDSIRLLAAQLAPDKPTLDQVYKLTHIEVGGGLPSYTEVNQACQLLKPYSKSHRSVRWITIG